jgi:hypothetical protein
MKYNYLLIVSSLFMAAALLAGCAGNQTAVEPAPTATATASVTATPDPCAPENLEAEVLKIHSFMRDFDDASTLAASMLPRNQPDQIGDAIANLQKIRREAENQPTPPCLANLKTYEISHMNSVINALLAFLEGNQQNFDQSSSLARQLHDQYISEVARLLGLTPVPDTLTVPTTQTPSP